MYAPLFHDGPGNNAHKYNYKLDSGIELLKQFQVEKPINVGKPAFAAPNEPYK